MQVYLQENPIQFDALLDDLIPAEPLVCHHRELVVEAITSMLRIFKRCEILHLYEFLTDKMCLMNDLSANFYEQTLVAMHFDGIIDIEVTSCGQMRASLPGPINPDW